MPEMYDRIEQLCQERSTNITALCKELSISRSSLAELKAGRSKSLSAASTAKIAAYFSVDPQYLLAGEKKAPAKLDEQLEGVEYALWGEVRDLTESEKQDILDYVRFKKKQRGDRV